MKKLQIEIQKLFEESEKAYNEELETPYEKTLLDILNFIKLHKNSKNEIIEILKDAISGKNAPLEAIAFCMRELKWLEIRDHTIDIFNKDPDPRKKALLTVITAYDTYWPDQENYEYFKDQ